MRRMPTKEEILERAREISVQRGVIAGLPAITPTEAEMKETGVFEEARIDLMTEYKAGEAEQHRYLSEMAEDLGMKVVSAKELRAEQKEKAKLSKEKRSLKWHVRGLKELIVGSKPTPSPRKVAWDKEALMRKIRRVSKKKGMVHIEKDLGITTDIHGNIVDKQAKKILASMLRKGTLFSPRFMYLKPTSAPRKRVKVGTVRRGKIWTGKKWVKHKGTADVKAGKLVVRRVSLREPLDIGAAIRGAPKKHRKPSKIFSVADAVLEGKPTVQAPKKVLKPKQLPKPKGLPKTPEPKLPKKLQPKKKKRKRSHTQRAGKTMKALRHVKGVTVFAFPDDVWKVRKPKR